MSFEIFICRSDAQAGRRHGCVGNWIAYARLARAGESPQFRRVNAVSKSAISDAPHPLQLKAWRAMGGMGRSELAAELRRKVRNWKRDALRAQHPAWTAVRIEQELARIYLRGNT